MEITFQTKSYMEESYHIGINLFKLGVGYHIGINLFKLGVGYHIGINLFKLGVGYHIGINLFKLGVGHHISINLLKIWFNCFKFVGATIWALLYSNLVGLPFRH